MVCQWRCCRWCTLTKRIIVWSVWTVCKQNHLSLPCMQYMPLELQKWNSVCAELPWPWRHVKCVYGKEYCRKLALCEEGERACFLWMLLTEIIAFNKACFYCLAFEWIDLFTSSHLHRCISACVCLSVEMHGRCAHTVLLYCACVVVSMHWCVCVCVCEGERGTVTLILIWVLLYEVFHKRRVAHSKLVITKLLSHTYKLKHVLGALIFSTYICSQKCVFTHLL